MDADLAQSLVSIKMVQYLQDICRNVNPGADALKGPCLLIKSHLKPRTLQQRSRRGTSQSGPNDSDADSALHVWSSPHAILCSETRPHNVRYGPFSTDPVGFDCRLMSASLQERTFRETRLFADVPTAALYTKGKPGTPKVQ